MESAPAVRALSQPLTALVWVLRLLFEFRLQWFGGSDRGLHIVQASRSHSRLQRMCRVRCSQTQPAPETKSDLICFIGTHDAIKRASTGRSFCNRLCLHRDSRCLCSLTRWEGIEPPTNGFGNRRSAAELPTPSCRLIPSDRNIWRYDTAPRLLHAATENLRWADRVRRRQSLMP